MDGEHASLTLSRFDLVSNGSACSKARSVVIRHMLHLGARDSVVVLRERYCCCKRIHIMTI
jgi:hypothetical protein